MDILRELSTVSTYKKPTTKGDLLVLYTLMQDPSITREQAIQLFQKSPSHFRNTYKLLKDKLTEGILTRSFKDHSEKINIEVNILKKHAAFKTLIKSHKLNAALKIGNELIAITEKRGLLSIGLDVSKTLADIYAFAGDKKYLKYREKRKTLMRLVMEEDQIQSFYNELMFRYKKNRSINDVLDQLSIYDTIAATNEQYKFRLRYYTSYSLIHQINNDIGQLAENTEAALTYCDTTKKYVPEEVVTLFLFDSIPICLYNKKFAKAQLYASRVIKKNVIGNNNWNYALQYYAIIGFQSDKPQIAVNAYLQLKNTDNLRQTKINKSRWHIIHAFLSLYNAVDKVVFTEPFDLHEFLNETAAAKNDSLMMNRYALELIHLLIAQNHRAYLYRADNIEQYISRNLKGSKNARVKYFMRLLKSVSVGDFHPIRVRAHAEKNRRKLQTTSSNLHLVDVEIVPYEQLWEMVLLLLSKGD